MESRKDIGDSQIAVIESVKKAEKNLTIIMVADAQIF